MSPERKVNFMGKPLSSFINVFVIRSGASKPRFIKVELNETLLHIVSNKFPFLLEVFMTIILWLSPQLSSIFFFLFKSRYSEEDCSSLDKSFNKNAGVIVQLCVAPQIRRERKYFARFLYALNCYICGAIRRPPSA